MATFPVSNHQILPKQPLDVPTAIKQCYSTQSFKPDPVAPEILRQLVEMIATSRSGCYLTRPMIIVQAAKQRSALAKAAFGQQQILQAPLTFVLAAVVTASKDNFTAIDDDEAERNCAWSEEAVYYLENVRHRGGQFENTRSNAIKDAIIAAAHLMLAAQCFGLATCPVSIWDEDKVKEIIGAWEDPDLAIGMLVTVGYAAEPYSKPDHLPVTNKVFVDKLGKMYEG